jgi:hypothetical protein
MGIYCPWLEPGVRYPTSVVAGAVKERARAREPVGNVLLTQGEALGLIERLGAGEGDVTAVVEGYAFLEAWLKPSGEGRSTSRGMAETNWRRSIDLTRGG